MDYIYLGNSGLKVPKYILGTIPFSEIGRAHV